MKLEDQVTSLELSKHLKELGVKQESVFWWCNFGKNDWRGPYFNREGNAFTYNGLQCFSERDLFDWCAAFTVAELGELLPKGMSGNGHIEGTGLHIGRKYEGEWFCGYSVHHISHGSEYPHTEWLHYETADSEADARAKMLIYLIENNLVTLADILSNSKN